MNGIPWGSTCTDDRLSVKKDIFQAFLWGGDSVTRFFLTSGLKLINILCKFKSLNLIFQAVPRFSRDEILKKMEVNKLYNFNLKNVMLPCPEPGSLPSHFVVLKRSRFIRKYVSDVVLKHFTEGPFPSIWIQKSRIQGFDILLKNFYSHFFMKTNPVRILLVETGIKYFRERHRIH